MSSDISSCLDGLTPVDFNLPADKFPTFRPIQAEAVQHAYYSDQRFIGLSLQPGSGKSLVAMTLHRLINANNIKGRTVILTSTKGLQNQYLSDFAYDPIYKQVTERLTGQKLAEKNLLVDMRGRNNYQCGQYGNMTCEEGQRVGCTYSGGFDCGYGEALCKARLASCVITNYKFWLNINQTKDGLNDPRYRNPISLLILDEAHLAEQELTGFLQLHISDKEVKDVIHLDPPMTESIPEWKAFTADHLKSIDEESKHLSLDIQGQFAAGKVVPHKQLDHQKRLLNIVETFAKIKSLPDDGWVCEIRESNTKKKYNNFYFDPITPARYAEYNLFRNIPKVILMSATLTPQSLFLLGISSKEGSVKEWGRVFPANRSPIYTIPCTKVSRNMLYSERVKWVRTIDEIIYTRLDRKGIIHTQSYEQAKFIFDHSQYRQYMYCNDPDLVKADDMYRRFRDRLKAPAILLSPSFGTGWDFPYTSCEWQIIAKVPFPVMQTKVMKERKARNELYGHHLCMQDLVQTCGRGMRAADDRCETFIVDDQVDWFVPKYKYLAPKWFYPSVRRMAAIPKPSQKLIKDP